MENKKKCCDKNGEFYGKSGVFNGKNGVYFYKNGKKRKILLFLPSEKINLCTKKCWNPWNVDTSKAVGFSEKYITLQNYRKFIPLISLKPQYLVM